MGICLLSFLIVESLEPFVTDAYIQLINAEQKNRVWLFKNTVAQDWIFAVGEENQI